MITNVELARAVLPSDGWSQCAVEGRELQASDLSQLADLGMEDPTFAWERTRQRPEYYSGLLQFRLGHYWRYGFGVHGIWRESKMVGQVGLQVLSEDNDQVELVVFLGHEFKRRGLGTCLANYLTQRCAAVGMSDLFGVVRVDNPEGLALMYSLGAHALYQVTHFGHEAQVFRISLKDV